MKTQICFFFITTVVLLILTSCISGEEHLSNGFDTLPEIDSTLLFEHSDWFSGATCDCHGLFLDRWYGTNLDVETVSNIFSEGMSHEGWTIWNEEVVDLWSYETDNGLLRGGYLVYSDPKEISQKQHLYQLPDSVYSKFFLFPNSLSFFNDLHDFNYR